MYFRIRDDEFDIDFMKSRGYMRKKCNICGSFFWTLNPEQDNCGETPCSNYMFLNNPPTKSRYSLKSLRDTFLSFFERHGHEIIDPYPVVARWRDDLLVTIASIANFQPFVTSGEASPPANPLVVSQPCLRFEDINNVGLTAGRHLTIFEMGGAHAFNDKRSGQFLYWKDGTISLHHEFAVIELGIPEEYITYKEHFWVGGGNAGPDVEGIISGLEVSTLVFMMYKIVNGKLEETPILTVDTGYGIERWAWLSTGYPTAFHVIFGDVLEKYLKMIGLEIDEALLLKDTLHSPKYDFERLNEVTNVRRKFLGDMGYDVDDALFKLNYFNDICRILDHSKAIIFLIKDGAIPSNVKEGYLTRMLFRRVFKIMLKYDIQEYLHELFDIQIKYWSKHFKDILDVSNIIHEVVDIEWEKYHNVLKKLPQIVTKYWSKDGIKIDDLIKIYDSYGIPPEVISEYVYTEKGVSLEVPPNFYELVSRKHMEREKHALKKVKIDIPKIDTEELYYINQYWQYMTAKILYAKDNFVILDKTVFYPEGGGQVGDTGYLVINGRKFRVRDTEKINGVIIHLLDREVDQSLIDKDALGYIDWERRYDIMRHHTSTHIVLSAIRRVLGPHIWQTGAEKREDVAHLDVTHYKLPSEAEIKEIEKLVNNIISKSIPVEVMWIDRGYAEKKYSPRIYQGGMVPGRLLRMIKIGDIDIEACGGTHVLNTSELRYIKIVSVERIHDGIIRFNYVAGDRAVELSIERDGKLNQVTKLLGCKVEELKDSISKILIEKKKLEKDYMDLYEKYIKIFGEKLYRDSTPLGSFKYIHYLSESVDELIKIGEFLDNNYDDVIFFGIASSGRGINTVLVIGRLGREMGLSARGLIMNTISKVVKGGGKGDARYARYGGRYVGPLNKLVEMIKDDIRKKAGI